MAGEWTFVGRQREVAELRSALTGSLGGQLRLVLLHGEPGIGKTRLAEELGRHAEGRGARVAWGRCWEGPGAPVYWPWVQLLRDPAIDDATPRLGPSSPRLAPLRASVTAEATAPLDDPDGARFALFDAVARLLGLAATSAPLVIVLDDLQWADLPSLALLKFVARELRLARVLIIGTYRTDGLDDRPQAAALLAAAGREGRVLPLAGLSVQELAQLAGAGASEGLVQRLHAATAGNPFFAEEVLRLIADGPVAEGAPLPVPATVREALHRRLQPLPGPTRALLAAGSVLGCELDPALLAEVSDRSIQEVLDGLGAAVPAALVRAEPAPSWSFAHDLIRGALYSGLPASERARLHLRAGEALERQLAAGRLVQPAEPARHFLAALPLGDPSRAARFAALAGRRAAAAHAFAEAIAHFLTALAVSERAGQEPHATIELLLDLGEARMAAGEARAGQQACQRAAELASALGAPDLLARAALAYGAAVPMGIVDRTHVALLQRALESVEASRPRQRLPLLARLASAMQPSQRPEEPIALARETIALARGTGDRVTLAAVLGAARSAFRVIDDLDERLAIDEETIRLAEETGDAALAEQAHRRQFLNLLERGDPASADLHLAAFEASCRAHPQRAGSALQLLQLRAGRLALTGRFAEAMALADQAEVAGARLREPGERASMATPSFSPQRLMIARAWGQPRLLEPLLARSFDPIDSFLRASLLARLGRLEEARGPYESAVALGVPAHLQFPPRAYLPEVCAALGDADRAEGLLALLAPLTGRSLVFVSPIAVCDGAVARLQALLAATLERWDEAEQHFVEALRMDHRLGAAPWVARSRLALAEMLERRGRSVDRQRARELRRDAAASFASLDMLLDREAAQAGPAASSAPVARPHPAPPASPASPAMETRLLVDAGRLSLSRHGEYWTLSGGAEQVHLRDSDGLRYLDHLMRHPDVEVPCVVLLSLGRGGRAERPGESDLGPRLDAQAKTAYRARLADLREQLAEATRFNDPVRAQRAGQEIERLSAELARAVGLGGRDRRLSSSEERARVNATLRIRAALKRIAEQSPALAHQLRGCVQTGRFCRYRPPPVTPVTS